jgi:hypothetical protein
MKTKLYSPKTTPGFVLARDVKATLWGSPVTLPAGADVVRVEGDGGGFAIASTALLIELTGNTHDPVYRFAWVDAADVRLNKGPRHTVEPGRWIFRDGSPWFALLLVDRSHGSANYNPAEVDALAHEFAAYLNQRTA